MREPVMDTLAFFDDHRSALPLYEAVEEQIFRAFPGAEKRVQKTQITFYQRHVFACVSFARVRRKAQLPDPYLVLTLGLPRRVDSPRAAVQTEPYPGRWTVHVVLGSERDLDEELLSLLREAWDFSQSKR